MMLLRYMQLLLINLQHMRCTYLHNRLHYAKYMGSGGSEMADPPYNILTP
jgi:hypothetical protein